MVINPTYLAQKTRTCMIFKIQTLAIILMSYSRQLARCPAEGYQSIPGMVEIGELSFYAREARSKRPDIKQAPEIQQMYSLNMPVSQVRTKIRQEFERHRYVSQMPVVDMLLFQCHAEYQVCIKATTLSRRKRNKSRTLDVGRRVKGASGHGRDCRGERLTLGPCKGNAQLLETITARSQVLSSGGEPNGETAGELYAKFPRGIFSDTLRCIHHCGEKD